MFVVYTLRRDDMRNREPFERGKWPEDLVRILDKLIRGKNYKSRELSPTHIAIIHDEVGADSGFFVHRGRQIFVDNNTVFVS